MFLILQSARVGATQWWRGGLGARELPRVRVRKEFGGLGCKYKWARMNDIFGLDYSSGFWVVRVP